MSVSFCFKNESAGDPLALFFVCVILFQCCSTPKPLYYAFMRESCHIQAERSRLPLSVVRSIQQWDNPSYGLVTSIDLRSSMKGLPIIGTWPIRSCSTMHHLLRDCSNRLRSCRTGTMRQDFYIMKASV